MKKTSYEFELDNASTRDKQWFWRVKHRNGREIARSSETYKRRSACLRALRNMLAAIGRSDYEIKETK